MPSAVRPRRRSTARRIESCALTFTSPPPACHWRRQLRLLGVGDRPRRSRPREMETGAGVIARRRFADLLQHCAPPSFLARCRRRRHVSGHIAMSNQEPNTGRGRGGIDRRVTGITRRQKVGGGTDPRTRSRQAGPVDVSSATSRSGHRARSSAITAIQVRLLTMEIDAVHRTLLETSRPTRRTSRRSRRL